VAGREIEVVARRKPGPAVNGEQGMASEEVICDETEVVAWDDQEMVEMVALDELWSELVQLQGVGDGRCDHGACAPMYYGELVARPAKTHFGGSFDAQVHFAPPLMPWRMQPEPWLVQQLAERCRKAGRHHQQQVPEMQLTGRCNTTAALLQERGGGRCCSCSCRWPSTTLRCLVCLLCSSIWRLI
jgi:hypothetical protein